MMETIREPNNVHDILESSVFYVSEHLMEIVPPKPYKDYKEVNIENVKGENRSRELVITRHLFALAVKKRYPKVSLKQIARHIGDRNHTTIIHGLDTLTDDMKTDKNIRYHVDAFFGLIGLKARELQFELEI